MNFKSLVTNKAIDMINDAYKTGNIRWFKEPCIIISEMIDKNNSKLANILISDLHRGAYLLSKSTNPKTITSNRGIERSLIKVSFDFINYLNLSEKYKNELRKIFHKKLHNLMNEKLKLDIKMVKNQW